MKSKTKGNILIGACLFFSVFVLFFLLYTKPAEPNIKYWIFVGVDIVAVMVFLLCLPFMRSLAEMKALPSSMTKYVIFFILASIWIILAIYFIRVVWHMGFFAAFLLALVLVGITNVMRQLIKADNKKMRSINKD
jgi:hypothetical protein